jgi:hypothetical protein
MSSVNANHWIMYRPMLSLGGITVIVRLGPAAHFSTKSGLRRPSGRRWLGTM